LEQVWIKLGRQPNFRDVKRPLSKYAASPYTTKFGTWRKALEAFVEYMNKDIEEPPTIEEIKGSVQETEIVFKHKTKRNPNSRLKVLVLMRDGNKCRLCGITVTGDNIHFDHIKPWSKGGETELDNLQVLCEQHNLAKGNLEYPKD
jgi:5-methylcytosine-specific restriction endonuclease McrA